MSLTLTLTWQPGTMNQVRFVHLNQRFIIDLRDVHRANTHSLNDLYLLGRVTLPVTAEHLHDLIMKSLFRQTILTLREQQTELEFMQKQSG